MRTHALLGRLGHRSRAADGYNLAARYYDRWEWQRFWRANEFPMVLEHLKPFAGRSVLDVGVGTGAFLSYARRELGASSRLCGVDVSDGMLAFAKPKLGKYVDLRNADVQTHLPFEHGVFHAVVMMRVANHIENLERALREIARVLAPGGLFVATDLADEYEYACTRIPVGKSKVSIETHKHSGREWQRLLAKDFHLDGIEIVQAQQLRSRVAGHMDFPKFDSPVFKIVLARKL